MADGVGLSDYEKQRLQNIARNNAVLNGLSIEKIPAVKKKDKPNKSKKRTLEVEDDRAYATRRSARLMDNPVELVGSIVDSSEEDSDYDKPKHKPKAIRHPKKLKLVKATPQVVNIEVKQPLPTRNADKALHFATHPNFTPNLTPKEVMQLGCFGGGYFREIHSGVTGQDYKDDYLEFPTDWFEGLDIPSQVTSLEYNPSKNQYSVKAGQGLKEWETSGWIVAQDPRGWFQWYCRYYLGRRSPDDARQISRWIGVCGPNGRWKKDLVSKIMKSGKSWDDKTISPIVRQTLQHWAYQLTESDYNLY